MDALMFLLSVYGAWLVADFITGVVHWWEDRYLGSMQSFDFAAGIAADNADHHKKPTGMLRFSQWENMRSGAVVGWPLAILLWCLGCPMLVWLSVFFSAFGNLVHRYAHTPDRQIPDWVAFLQAFGIFSSPTQHRTHHYGPEGLVADRENSMHAYCTLTDQLNPFLDALRFWHTAEAMLSGIGIHPQPYRLDS